ncbi:hypothetical protein GCM10017688_53360 [Streptomyces ramulosus]
MDPGRPGGGGTNYRSRERWWTRAGPEAGARTGPFRSRLEPLVVLTVSARRASRPAVRRGSGRPWPMARGVSDRQHNLRAT